MRKRTSALVSFALLLSAAALVGCGGPSKASIKQPDCCGGGTSQPTAGQAITSGPAAGTSNAGLYIALGDSLSFGIGASDVSKTSFVALVHASLGPRYELLNLGVLSDTSQNLIDHGNLDRAVQVITQRKSDGDPNNDVRLVTLEIGENDLFNLYASVVETGKCPDVETMVRNPACVDALRSVFDQFRANLVAILDRLRGADPALRIILLTLYNPLENLPGVGDLGDMSLEGRPGTPFPEGLNDIMHKVAQGRADVKVVDIFSRFHGRATQLIAASDNIHPNDAGHRVMADAIIAALQ